MALKQEIIKFVRLSITEGIRNIGFSSPCISIEARSLIRVKSVSKSAEYLGQLFISIITLMGFGPWASRRCESISCSSVSNRISRSILPIRIVVHRDNTWARNRWNCLARLNCTGRRPQRWMISLVNSSWASWHIWQISHLVTEIWDHIEGCPKQWDWSWRVTARGSYLDFEVQNTSWIADGTTTEGFSRQNCSEAIADLGVWFILG